MSKLGIGYDELKEINPKIIYCAITGYGQTGPMALRAGHDINYMSRSGTTNVGTAYPEVWPLSPSIISIPLDTGVLKCSIPRERSH